MSKEIDLLEQVKTLTEIELDAFLEGLKEHLQKNKTTHLIDQNFELEDSEAMEDLSDEVSSLESKIEDLENDLEDMTEDRDILQKKIDKVKSAIE